MPKRKHENLDRYDDSEHAKLAGTIKELHATLRKKYQKGGNADEVWQSHVTDKPTLAKYAQSMKSLATNHWSKKKETRIDWCHQFITSYFSENGKLQSVLDKEERSRSFHTDKLALANAVDKEHIQCCHHNFTSEANYIQHCTEVVDDSIHRQDHLDSIKPPVVTRIRLLDAGSCYAPFKGFEQYDCLSIDLWPASPDVFCCDLLTVPIDNSSEQPELLKLSPTETSVKSLPSQYFHGIVFSLLLEYMPSAMQRWHCCCRAHKLLKGNGVLVIVTPDSNKQHRHAAMIKDWKQAIESLGFQRCCYEKKEHLHCMAFRKIRGETSSTQDLSEKLYIPQDFTTSEASDSDYTDTKTWADNSHRPLSEGKPEPALEPE